jgi:peroxiredoxin
MKKTLACLLTLLVAPAAFALETGKAAPDFTAKASNGKTVKLSDYKGKTVVLEWLNYGCPFVKKHYESKNMQNLQKKYTGDGVVWLSVISSAPGKQGHADAKQAEADRAAHGSNATAILLDEKGEVGKAYGAATTPHMYVIDKSGKLVYQGAIDDKASTDLADVKTATNYVSAALDATKAGKPVAVSQTKAYGCGVKYN